MSINRWNMRAVISTVDIEKSPSGMYVKYEDYIEELTTLKAQRDELALSLRKAALDFLNANGTIPSWWKDCVDIVKPILADKVESIANAEKDKA